MFKTASVATAEGHGKELALAKSRFPPRSSTASSASSDVSSGTSLPEQRRRKVREAKGGRASSPSTRIPKSFSVESSMKLALFRGLSGSSTSEHERTQSRKSTSNTTGTGKSISNGGSFVEAAMAGSGSRLQQASASGSVGKGPSFSGRIQAKEAELNMFRQKQQKAEAAVKLMEQRLKAKTDASAALLHEVKAAKQELEEQLAAKEEEMRVLLGIDSGRDVNQQKQGRLEKSALLKALSKRTLLKGENFLQEEGVILSHISNSSPVLSGLDEEQVTNSGMENEQQVEQLRQEVSFLRDQLTECAVENMSLKEELQQVKEAEVENKLDLASKDELLAQRQQQVGFLNGQLLRLRQEQDALTEELRLRETEEAVSLQLNCLRVENEGLKHQLCSVLERHGVAMGASGGAHATQLSGGSAGSEPCRECQHLRAKAVELEDEVSALKERLGEAEISEWRDTDVSDLQELVRELKEENKAVREELQAIRANEGVGEEDYPDSGSSGLEQRMRIELQKTKQELRQLKTQHMVLQEQLGETTEHLQRELDSATMESEALREQMLKQAQDSAWEVEKLREENASLEDQLRQEARSMSFRLDSLNEERSAEEEEMMQELQEFSTRVDTLEQEKNGLLEQLRNEAATAALQAAALSEANAALQDRLGRDRVEADQQLRILQAEKASLESQLEHLSARVQEVQERQNSAEEVSVLHARVGVLEAEKAALEQALQNASSGSADADDRDDCRRSELAEAGLELRDLREANEVLERRMLTLHEENLQLMLKSAEPHAKDDGDDSSAEVIEEISRRFQDLLREKAALQMKMKKESAAAAVQVHYLLGEKAALEEKIKELTEGAV